MKIDKVLDELEQLFTLGQMNRIEDFLKEQIEIATKEKDGNACLTLLNELIGFYRVTTRFPEALQTIEEIQALLVQMDLQETTGAGTSWLNIATLYRAMGRFQDAAACYKKAEAIYEKQLEPDDYRMAGLYNNYSLYYQETDHYELAVSYQEKALAVICRLPDTLVQQAVSHTNLGQVYTKMRQWDKAAEHLKQAETLFSTIQNDDEHYSGLANAFGYYYMQREDYKAAVGYYETALFHVNHFYGKTQNYNQIQKDLFVAYKKAGYPVYNNMLDLCQAYYETYGKKMIHDNFPEYEKRIAVGLCGEGSECFKMEDRISMDHDCGPGFSMWVTRETYDAMGIALQAAYEELPKVFAGYIREDTVYGQGRCGVCIIDDFYKRVLGKDKIPEHPLEWNSIDEAFLATATNGKVFVDEEGLFTRKRESLLAYYPEGVWLEKLGKKLIYAAQTGQYNYGRMMARGDYVTAGITLSKYMETIMEVVYLLNRTYCPYYKWKRKMMGTLQVLPEIGPILDAIGDMPSQRQAWEHYTYNGNPNPNDMIAQTIEIIAKLVTDVLQKMELSDMADPYLEVQGQAVLRKALMKKEYE